LNYTDVSPLEKDLQVMVNHKNNVSHQCHAAVKNADIIQTNDLSAPLCTNKTSAEYFSGSWQPFKNLLKLLETLQRGLEILTYRKDWMKQKWKLKIKRPMCDVTVAFRYKTCWTMEQLLSISMSISRKAVR